MNPRRDWLAGLVVGAWAGFYLVYFPFIGAVLIVGFSIGAAIGRSLAADGGLLAGAGGLILMMLALLKWNCAGNYGLQDGACTPPDLTGFLIEGSALALGGGIVTVLALVTCRRAHARRP
jgi:hypothetical protein